MGIPELARFLQIARHQGGTGSVVVVQDEEGDVSTIPDAYLDPAREVLGFPGELEP
jgi:hypothetical protein